MFYSFDTTMFGVQLKNIRKQQGLSQAKVSSQLGIHVDTLRKLENGKVMPKHETLELLSSAYKVDLFSLYQQYRSDDYLIQIYSTLNKIMNEDNIPDSSFKCEQLLEQLENYDSYDILVTQELNQLKELIHCILLCNQEAYDHETVNRITSAIQLTHPTFTIDYIGKFNFTQLEGHLLHLLAIVYFKLRINSESNLILFHLLTSISKYNEHYNYQIEKIYHLISYNFHIMEEDWNAMLYAEKGILYANQHRSSYLLGSLYSRKSIALYHLGFNNEAKIQVEISLNIFKATGNTYLYNCLLDIFINKYSSFS